MKEVSTKPKYKTGDILMLKGPSKSDPLPLMTSLILHVQSRTYIVLTDGVLLPWLLDIKKLDKHKRVVKVGKL